MRCLALTAWALAAQLARLPVAAEQLTVDLPGGQTMGFVWIDPGTFLMGTTKQQKGRMDASMAAVPSMNRYSPYFGWELPAHRVTLTRGFYLGQHEVSKPQWKAVMGTTPWAGWSIGDSASPAVGVSWFDAQDFAARLNDAAGDSVYRLPTEAEWEYACRAGTETLWYVGDDWVGAWEMPLNDPLTNPWGLYNMIEGVCEWVLDGFRPYTDAPQIDPLGPVPGEVIRGGSVWAVTGNTNEQIMHSRSAFRAQWSPGRRDAFWVGFRLVRRQGGPTGVEPSSWGAIKRPKPE